MSFKSDAQDSVLKGSNYQCSCDVYESTHSFKEHGDSEVSAHCHTVDRERAREAMETLARNRIVWNLMIWCEPRCHGSLTMTGTMIHTHDNTYAQDIFGCVHCQTLALFRSGNFDLSLRPSKEVPRPRSSMMDTSHDGAFDQEVIPIHHSEEKWPGSFGVSVGRSAAYVHLHRDSTIGRFCFVKIDTHNRQLTVRCLTSHGSHYGSRSACCKAVCEYWNERNPENHAELISRPVRSSHHPTRQDEIDVEKANALCEWPFSIPDSIRNRPWFARNGLPIEKLTKLESGEPEPVGLMPDVDVEGNWDDHYTAELVMDTRVYGWHFSHPVQVFNFRSKVDASIVHRFSFRQAGLFRHKDDLWDASVLYKAMHDVIRGCSIQSFYDEKTEDYCAWIREHPAEQRHPFVKLQPFYEVFHSWIEAQVPPPSNPGPAFLSFYQAPFFPGPAFLSFSQAPFFPSLSYLCCRVAQTPLPPLPPAEPAPQCCNRSALHPPLPSLPLLAMRCHIHCLSCCLCTCDCRS